MTKLKLGALLDEKPVRITVELPAALHRQLVASAHVLERDQGGTVEPARLVAPMLARFIDGDRAFAKAQRTAGLEKPPPVPQAQAVD